MVLVRSTHLRGIGKFEARPPSLALSAQRANYIFFNCYGHLKRILDAKVKLRLPLSTQQ
jgi:hypothetical protein